MPVPFEADGAAPMGSITKITPSTLLGPLTDAERTHAPKALFLMGDPGVFSLGTRVAVVGTRRPSDLGVRRTRAVATRLAEKGMVTISGLAEGVDYAAHTAAIEAGGRTIAVVGTGVDRFFPEAHRELQQRIAREHLLLSQFPPGTPPKRGNFPQRNKTMALMCDATIIIEAGETSGTLHQGWEAIRLGRPLFLLESLLQRTDLTWSAKMATYGAQVLTLANLDAVLDAIPVRVASELAF